MELKKVNENLYNKILNILNKKNDKTVILAVNQKTHLELEKALEYDKSFDILDEEDINELYWS